MGTSGRLESVDIIFLPINRTALCLTEPKAGTKGQELRPLFAVLQQYLIVTANA